MGIYSGVVVGVRIDDAVRDAWYDMWKEMEGVITSRLITRDIMMQMFDYVVTRVYQVL